MSYSPGTDLLALLRQTSGGARSLRMPGLDYVMAALSRANMFILAAEATPPSEQREITVWLRPASPSWSAEGAVFLFNSETAEYEPATNALWAALFTRVVSSDTIFQRVTTANAAVLATTTLLGIQRGAPAATVLTLPSVAIRTRPLQIVDWSTGVTDHHISLDAAAGETIMQLVQWNLFSTADQLSGVTLNPSTDLGGWVIAP